MRQSSLLLPMSLFALSLSASATMTGCGSTDPLVGKWKTMQAISGQPSTLTEVMLNADQTAKLHLEIAYPATSALLPGCTLTEDASGISWTTSAPGNTAGTLAYSGASITASVTIAGCKNATDNRTTTTVTQDATGAKLDTLGGSYTISADRQSLTITQTFNGVTVSVLYTRE